MRLYFWKLTSRVPGPKNCVNCASTHTHHRIVPCISKILLCENNYQGYIIKKNFIYLNKRVQSQVTDWNLPSYVLQLSEWGNCLEKKLVKNPKFTPKCSPDVRSLGSKLGWLFYSENFGTRIWSPQSTLLPLPKIEFLGDFRFHLAFHIQPFERYVYSAT